VKAFLATLEHETALQLGRIAMPLSAIPYATPQCVQAAAPFNDPTGSAATGRGAAGGCASQLGEAA